MPCRARAVRWPATSSAAVVAPHGRTAKVSRVPPGLAAAATAPQPLVPPSPPSAPLSAPQERRPCLLVPRHLHERHPHHGLQPSQQLHQGAGRLAAGQARRPARRGTAAPARPGGGTTLRRALRASVTTVVKAKAEVCRAQGGGRLGLPTRRAWEPARAPTATHTSTPAWLHQCTSWPPVPPPLSLSPPTTNHQPAAACLPSIVVPPPCACLPACRLRPTPTTAC